MTVRPETLDAINKAIAAIEAAWLAGTAPAEVMDCVLACQRELTAARRLLKARESGNDE